MRTWKITYITAKGKLRTTSFESWPDLDIAWVEALKWCETINAKLVRIVAQTPEQIQAA